MPPSKPPSCLALFQGPGAAVVQMILASPSSKPRHQHPPFSHLIACRHSSAKQLPPWINAVGGNYRYIANSNGAASRCRHSPDKSYGRPSPLLAGHSTRRDARSIHAVLTVACTLTIAAMSNQGLAVMLIRDAQQEILGASQLRVCAQDVNQIARL